MPHPQKLSGSFAQVSGLLMLFFTLSGFWVLLQSNSRWFLYIVLIWALLTSGFTIFWGTKTRSKYKRAVANGAKVEDGIGLPTLEMVGGVSAAILAAVTFTLLFASEEKSSTQQVRVLCALTSAQQRSDSHLGDTCKPE